MRSGNISLRSTFPAQDYLSVVNKKFIADLMPTASDLCSVAARRSPAGDRESSRIEQTGD